MGCLSVSASVIGQGLSCKANLLNTGVAAFAKCLGGIHCEAELIGESLKVSASKYGTGLKVSAHQVCSLNKSAYLNAIPDTLWLTPDMLASAEFEIISHGIHTVIECESQCWKG